MNDTGHELPKIERISAVLARTGLSRTGLYEAIQAGDFPEQVQISKRAVGFLESEVTAWIKARASKRNYK